MNFQDHCPERYWQKAHPQPRDSGMPERSWGYCLPGDEAGWMCALEEGGCAESPKDCPLFVKRHDGIYENDGIFWNEFTGKFWEKEEAE